MWERGETQIVLSVDGRRQRVTFAQHEEDCWLHTLDGTFRLTWIDPLPSGRIEREAAGSLRSPMPGQVIAVLVQSGQHVKKGDKLLVVEAMKMEHRIQAPHDGLVTAIYYETGQSVQAGVTLLDLRASDEIPPANAEADSSPDAG
jgi:biotin carboxyl carrier protein